jgi:competence protein ComEC
MKLKALIILIIMGLCYDIALILSFEKIYPEETEISFIGEILEKKKEDCYIVKVLENEKISISKNTKLIVYLKEEYFAGDILKIEGNFEKGEVDRNYKGFNYRRYLKQNKIYGIVFSKSERIINKRKDMYFLLEKIRDIFNTQIDNLYKEEYSGFVKGILIGNKNELDEQIINNFKASNISHILAISGLHISFIIIGIKFVLDKLINSKKIKNSILVIFLIIFWFITGKSISCMRACIMNIFIISSSIFYRKNSFYISFLYSLIFIIVLNPYNIFSVGMWLSYLGTIGIVLLYKLFYKIVYKKLKNKFISKSFSLSLSAQILIFPVMIYVFNNFSLNFFIANIIVSFFISYILVVGYISIFISFILFPFAKILVNIECLMIYIVFKTAEITSCLPFSKISLVTPNIILIILYYIIIFYFVIYFKNNKFKILKAIINFKLIIVVKKLFIFITIIILISQINIVDFKLKIYFVDVQQGDCTLIRTPYGKNIIIDGGEGNSEKYDYGEKVVYPYLLDRRIKKIDYLVASHADSDHMGGLIYILENMKVNHILIGIQPQNSKQLEKLIYIANKKNVKIVTLKHGDEIKIDKDVKIQVLFPVKNNLISENSLNNNSLVFKLQYNKFSMMFTGDIEKIAENELVNLYEHNTSVIKTTILKIAHHGSNSSSSKEFLEIVSPQIAVIGVGKDNKYGHPSEDVLLRLKNYGTKIYRTDESGEIEIEVKKNGKYKVKCHLCE